MLSGQEGTMYEDELVGESVGQRIARAQGYRARSRRSSSDRTAAVDNGLMNVPHAARLWTLSVLVALSAAGCNAVDHSVGAATEDGGGGNTGAVVTTSP